MKQRLEVLESMKLDFRYSSKWKKRKNVAVDIEELIGTENKDELEPTTDPIATSTTTSRPSQVSQTRVLEHLDEEIVSLNKSIYYL